MTPRPRSSLNRSSPHRRTLRALTLVAIVSGGLLSAPLASAQSFVEYQHRFRDGSPSPTLDGQLFIPGKTVNVVGWFLVSDDWGEAEVGISKSIRPWLWAAVMAGLEADEAPWRANVTAGGGKGRLSVFFTNEVGGSGYWYKFTSTARVAPLMEIGVHSQRFYGTGPLVQVSLGQGFGFWASLVKGPQSLVGITKSF